MPFRVYVKGFGRKEMAKLQLNMRRATIKGMELVAKKTAEFLKNNILAYQLIWRGLLIDSIKVHRIKRSAIGISTIYYGPIVDKGHIIPPRAAKSPYLRAWAYAKLPEPKEWLKKVEAGYKVQHPVPARPFIRDAINAISLQVPVLMRMKLEQGGKV